MNTDGKTESEADGPPSSVVNSRSLRNQRKFRDAVVMLIDGTEGFRCAGSYRSTEEALDKIAHDLPDVRTNGHRLAR